MSEADSHDADSATAVEILRGAARGPRDPDVSLFVMLTELDRRDNDELTSYLQRLVRDAPQN
jgi:hypothetical protein